MILVVDDEPVVCEMMREIFEARGHKVRIAANGMEAIMMLGGGLNPKLILLDMVMPGMDGNKFLEELQQISDQAPPVIVLSAYMSELRSEHRSFVAACVSKPPDCQKLVSLVERYVQPEGQPIAADTEKRP